MVGVGAHKVEYASLKSLWRRRKRSGFSSQVRVEVLNKIRSKSLTEAPKASSTRAMEVTRIDPKPRPIEDDAAATDGFEAMVAIYRHRIFRFALASLRDRDAAETVTQDCLLRAYKGAAQFRGDSSVHTWLMRIAVNLVRDVARNPRWQFWKRSQASAVDLGSVSDWIPDHDASPEEQLAAKERVAAIWNVVGSLSQRQRTVFLLHFMEEKDPAEIEAITGFSRAAIKVHLFRAVRAIRERLRGLE